MRRASGYALCHSRARSLAVELRVRRPARQRAYERHVLQRAILKRPKATLGRPGVAPQWLRRCRMLRTAGQSRASHVCMQCAAQRPHLRRDWAHPRHICARTALIPPASTPGLRSPPPHLHRDWAHRLPVCAGTGLTPATSAPGLRSPVPPSALTCRTRGWVVLAGMDVRRGFLARYSVSSLDSPPMDAGTWQYRGAWAGMDQYSIGTLRRIPLSFYDYATGEYPARIRRLKTERPCTLHALCRHDKHDTHYTHKQHTRCMHAEGRKEGSARGCTPPR